MAIVNRTGSRVIGSITIPSGGTTSDKFYLGETMLCAFLFPAMTNTTVSLYGGKDLTDTFVPIANSSDVSDTITVSGTSKIRYVTPQNFAGIPYIQLVGGSSEASERTIYILGKE